MGQYDRIDNPTAKIPKHYTPTTKKRGFAKKPKDPFKIIAWNSQWDEEDAAKGRIRLKDIFPDYNKEHIAKKDDFNTLSEYLQYYNRDTKTMESVRKSILNALIHILRLNNRKFIDETDRGTFEKFFTKRAMINTIKSYMIEDAPFEAYNLFKLKLYKWSFDLSTRKEIQDVHKDVKLFINTEFTQWFQLTHTSDATVFLNSFKIVPKEIATKESTVNYPIEIGTVHSVKGQIHCATMYIETSYYDYETNKIKDKAPFFMQKHKCKQSREKETLKMLYVGFSRPTHLLCFAVLEDNLKKSDVKLFEEAGWKIC